MSAIGRLLAGVSGLVLVLSGVLFFVHSAQPPTWPAHMKSVPGFYVTVHKILNIATGAVAMARLGHTSMAVACLLDRLSTATGHCEQHILCGLATVLWRDAGRTNLAVGFLNHAGRIDPDSAAAEKAFRLLRVITEHTAGR